MLVADGKEASAINAIKAAQGGSGVGDAELQLLAARTYAQWRGHVPDAVAIYDGLIEVGVPGRVWRRQRCVGRLPHPSCSSVPPPDRCRGTHCRSVPCQPPCSLPCPPRSRAPRTSGLT